jgi:hypothetical protein
MAMQDMINQLMGNSQQPKIMAMAKPEVKGLPGSIDIESLLLNDPKKLGIDHEKSDWKVVPDDDPEQSIAVSKFVKEQFEKAYRTRQEMELEWMQALAYFEGRQWYKVNSNARNLASLQDPNEANRYITVNKMRPLIDGVVGKLTQVSPDARAVPLSYNDNDRAAADEANHIAGNYTRKFNRETQLKERVRWACVTGTAFVKIWWNAKAEQVMPYFDQTGQVTGFEKLPIGDVEEEIIPCFNVYIDPHAQTDRQIRWMIHASIKPLSWFTDNYGDAGKKVKPNALTGQSAGYVDAYLEGANGTGMGWVQPTSARLNAADHRRHASIVYEYWEKPTAQFPKGRYIVTTDDTLLWAGIWPYKKRDEFPFIPLRWQPRSGTPYGHSLGFDLTHLQLTYNRIYSRAVEQMEKNKDYVVIERRSRIGADAFNVTGDDIDDKNRQIRKIYYDTGTHPPQIQRAPGISADLFPFLQVIEKDMADIAGLHDVSQGMAQAGTPAESVRLLQRADNTQHSYIRADIEISSARIKEWEISLVEQFAVAPFMGSVDDQMNSHDPAKQGVINFESIRNGGQYRVVYVPGSTQEDSPEQKLQKVSVLRQMGLFGDPADPETNALVVKMLQLPETSQILEHLAAQQQKQQEQQQAAMQMQQEQMAAQSAPKQQFDPEAEQMKAELEAQKLDMKGKSEIEKISAQSQARQDEFASQKIADFQHQVMLRAAGVGKNQGTPRPDSSRNN